MLISPSRRSWSPTGATRLAVVCADGRAAGLTSATVTVEPDDGGGPVWSFPGFDAPVGATDRSRARLLADIWQTLVVHVQVPGGPGPRPAPLRHDQRRALLVGDLTAVAHEMTAAHAASAPGASPVLLGYSLGASCAAAAARVLASVGTRPRAVLLVEPVATAPWTPWALARANAREASLPLLAAVDVTDGDANDQRAGVRRTDSALLAWSLTRGRLVGDLLAAAARVGPFPVHLVTGTASALARTSATRTARAALDAAGCTGRWTRLDGATHALWHNATVAETLARTHRLEDL